jgi:hypothetical protein
VSVKAWGNLLQMMGCHSVDILVQLLESEGGLRFAVRLVKEIDQRPDNTAAVVHQPLLLAGQRCHGLLGLHREVAGLLAEAPTSGPELLGQSHEWRIGFFCTARLDLPAVGEQRFCEVPPDMLDGMARVGRKAGLRQDRFDGCGAALGVIREGRGPLEAAVCASWQKLPGIRTICRRRFMGEQDAALLILDHHDPVIRAPWVVAIHVTRRRRGERQQLPQHLLGRGPRHANVIHPAWHGRRAHGDQEQHSKEERHGPETDAAHDREVTGQPDHAGAPRLGGRDTLDCRRAVYALVLGVQGRTLRDHEPILDRMVARRQFMQVDVVGGLAPTHRRGRPQLTLQVELAQSERDNRRAVFDGRTDESVLVPLRDRRRKLRPRSGDRPLGLLETPEK